MGFNKFGIINADIKKTIEIIEIGKGLCLCRIITNSAINKKAIPMVKPNFLKAPLSVFSLSID